MNNSKTELLDEVDTVLNPQKGVDLRYLIYVLLSITLVCVAVFPKIYLQQQIYFKSRDISKLKGEYDTLKEENRLISTSVESIKFKNQILDTLF
jgi:cell division protein FtsL